MNIEKELKQKELNKTQEALAGKTTIKQEKRKWKTIAKELGDRQITMKDVIEFNKISGLNEIISITEDATLNDLVVLRQYAEAIYGKNPTKSAEFLRDTSGEKPTTSMEVTQHKSPFDDLSEAELEAMLHDINEK